MKLKYFFIGVAVFAGCWTGDSARAAVLYPFAYENEVALNSIISVDLRLNSESETVNAVEMVLRFDPNALEVVSFSRSNSWLTLWTDLPTVVSPGKILLSGGRPDGSLVEAGSLVTVSFKALRTGQTDIAIQPALSTVYLHDGLDQAAALSARSLQIDVIDPQIVLTQPAVPSHPANAVWSSVRDVVFRWNPLQEAVVSYRLSRDPIEVPDEVTEENTGLANFPGLSEGVWYLTFMEKFPAQPWSSVFRHELRIDATPPPLFEVVLERDVAGNVPVFFAAEDRESGIVGYQALLERNRWWTPWTRESEILTVPGPFVAQLSQRLSRVAITAFDAAGNTRTVAVPGPSRPNGYGLLFLVLSAIAALCGILLLLIQTHHRKKRRIARR